MLDDNSSYTAGTAKRLIITVHGIRTFGKWQERLEGLVEQRDSGILFYNYKYGYFSVLAFLFPPLRWIVVRRFRTALRLVLANRHFEKIDLVGHSFGTHILAWALWGLNDGDNFVIDTVVLSGSVLRAGFQWSRLIGSRVRQVANDCGTRDFVLVLSQFFVLFTGSAGRTGFSGMTNPHFRNRFSEFGHSGYFLDEKGNPDDGYMEANWLPLLISKGPIPHFTTNSDGGGFNGIVWWLSNNAEPIKLSLYLTPIVLFALWVVGQRNEARQQTLIAREQTEVATKQRDRAQTNETKLVVREAIELQSRAEYGDAAKKLIDVLPSQDNIRPYLAMAEKELYSAFMGLRKLAVLLTNGEIRFAPDGKSFAVNAFDKLEMWSSQTHARLWAAEGTDRFAPSAFSPDGSTVVTAFQDDSIRLLDTRTGKELHSFIGYTGRVTYLAFSRDGSRIASASTDKTARIWNLDSGQSIALTGDLDTIRVASFSSDGTRIVTASDDGVAGLWNADTGKFISWLRHSQGAVTSATFSPDGSQIATSGVDRTARIWDARTGAALFVLQHDEPAVSEASYASNDMLITRTNKAVYRWDVRTFGLISAFSDPLKFEDPPRWITTSAISSDGKYLFIGFDQGPSEIWRLQDRYKIATLQRYHGAVRAAAFSPDGSLLVSSSYNHNSPATVLWSATPPTSSSLTPPSGLLIRSTTLSPDFKKVSEVTNKDIEFWDNLNSRMLDQMSATDPDSGGYARVSPDQTLVFKSSGDTPPTLTKVGGETISLPLDRSKLRVERADFSQDGRKVAAITQTSTYTKFLSIWKTTGQLIAEWPAPGQSDVLKFSPDSRILLLANRLYKADTGQEITTLAQREASPINAEFIPEGLLTINGDKTVKLWDVKTGALIFSYLHDSPVTALTGKTSPVPSLFFGWFATGTKDGTIYVWDIFSHLKPFAKLRGHLGPVTSLHFSNDGYRLATSGEDHFVRIWIAPNDPKFNPVDNTIAVLPLASPARRLEFNRDRSRIFVASAFTVETWPLFSTTDQLIGAVRSRLSRSLNEP